MANVVTEHILLLVPVFFAIMIFGLLATNLTSGFSDQQRQIIVESYEEKFTSTIQQLYYIMKDEKIQDCTVTLSSPLPTLIDGQNYEIIASVENEKLILVFSFPGINERYNTTFPLAHDFRWSPVEDLCILKSDSILPRIQVEKRFDSAEQNHIFEFSFLR